MCSFAGTMLTDEVAETTEIYFLTVVEAASPGSRIRSFQVLLRWLEDVYSPSVSSCGHCPMHTHMWLLTFPLSCRHESC